jgi:hypothetical protein
VHRTDRTRPGSSSALSLIHLRWAACTGPSDPRVGGDTAAIVASGSLIALNSDLTDDGLRADVLAMALEVATVITDRPDDRPGTVYAPSGFVVITPTRVPAPAAGVGRFATLMARKSGRDTPSAAFEYHIPRAEYHTPGFPGDGH